MFVPKYLLRVLPVGFGLFTTLVAFGQGGAPADAPPQFLTPPLHAPEQVSQTVGGHLVYTPVSGIFAPGSSTTVVANATFTGSPEKVGGNVDVSNALDSYQGEPMLFSKGSLLVGGYNSIYPGNCSAALGNCAPGSAAASPTGISWTTSRLPITINGHAFLIGYDPSVAADAVGTFYYLYGVSDASVSGKNGIAVASSSNGVNWILKTPVTFNSGGQFDDKPWIAADPVNSGYLVAGWDRNKGNDQILYAAVSSDGGNSWTAPIKVNDGNTKFERVIYAFPAFDPTGNNTVYMAWLDYAKNIIFVDKSTNGGLAWGTDIAAATTHIGFGKDIGCNGGRSMSPAPQMGVDGNGSIYLTYADQINGGRSGNYDIFLVKSTDGGAHWSAPVKLNDDGGTTHQYNPALSVLPDATGTVNVSWYDRRNDPNNCSTDIYATVSTNGGATFSTNARVTPVSSNYDGNPNGPGDYSGNAPAPSSSSVSFPLWCSHLFTDITKETGTAGGFEIYTAPVSH